MQKKLIALAIAGLASSAAFAQSNVTLYGVADASVDFTKVGNSPTATGVNTTKISSNTSRIGFKGSEDLGNGLKAVFQLETGFNVDGNSAGSLNSRNTFVGLAHDSWGRVILGQYDTPYKTSSRGWDQFADHLGDNRNLMGSAEAGSSVVPFDNRPANTVRYDSPNWAGFNLALAYVARAESVTTTAPKASTWSVSGSYDILPELRVIAAYEKHSNVNNTTNVAAAINEEKAWKIGAAYTAGPFGVSAVYEKIDDDFSAVGLSNAHKAWTVAGNYYITASDNFRVAYTRANKFDNGTPGADDTGAKQYAIGYDHILSKRTKLYAEYVKLKNDTNGTYFLGGASTTYVTGTTNPLAADADPSALSLGVKHSF